MASCVRKWGEDLCQQKGVEVLEGHAIPGQIQIGLKILPKDSVSYFIGFLWKECCADSSRTVA